MRTERFGLVLSPDEKRMLRCLAERERLSAAAVVRRLIWREAKRLPPADQHPQGQGGEQPCAS